MNKLRVLLVDDHTVVRRGLRKILELVPQIEVVGEVGDGTAALAATSSLHPDVVLMDVSMQGLNGIEATRQITAQAPRSRVLMLSMHTDEQYERESRAAGAKGYMLKDVEDQDLIEAILAVGRGETCFGATLRQPGQCPCSPDVLSPKERRVLCLISAGLTNREMAEELGLSVHTIETHRRHVMDKLDLHSTAELVRYAARHDLLI